MGNVGEAVFFFVLLAVGCLALAGLIAQHISGADAVAVGFSFYLVLLVVVSFVIAGGVGLAYTLLNTGMSPERRRTITRRAARSDAVGRAEERQPALNAVPDDSNITNSPGTKLAYRLPVATTSTLRLFAAAVVCLTWNSVVVVLAVLAGSGRYAGGPTSLLLIASIPFLAIGAWSIYFFLRELLHFTGIGPTSIEVSDHPLRPGRTYEMVIVQAGRLSVKSLQVRLICDEEATFRQGTDVRSETCRVASEVVLAGRDFQIRPDAVFEQSSSFTVPATAMHSFQSEHNSVLWKLLVSGDVVGWRSFQRTFPVVVLPADEA